MEQTSPFRRGIRLLPAEPQAKLSHDRRMKGQPTSLPTTRRQTHPSNALQPLPLARCSRLLGRCCCAQQYERLTEGHRVHHDISGPAPCAGGQFARRASKMTRATRPSARWSDNRLDRMSSPAVATTRRTIFRRRDLSHAGATEPVSAGLTPRRPTSKTWCRCATPGASLHRPARPMDRGRVPRLHRTNSSAYTRIDQHFEQLRGWAEHMDQRGAWQRVRPVGCVPRPGGQWHRAGRHGGPAAGHRPRAARGRRAVGHRGLDTHRCRWPLDRGPASRAASSQIRLQQLAAGGA